MEAASIFGFDVYWQASRQERAAMCAWCMGKGALAAMENFDRQKEAEGKRKGKGKK